MCSSFSTILAHFFKLLSSLNLFLCLESVAVFSKQSSIAEVLSVLQIILQPQRTY